MREEANKKALARFSVVGAAAKVNSLEKRATSSLTDLGEKRSIARATAGGISATVEVLWHNGYLERWIL
jgi:hypothetical protein